MPTLPNLTVNSFAIPPSPLWYWYYYFQKQKALFQRYNSSRVDLYARTKDLWVSSSCGDSYEIQAYHMTIKAQCFDLWLTIHIMLCWGFRPISTQKLNQDHHQGWYFECKIRHQRPPCGTQINQDFIICMCLWNFSNPIRVHTWTIPILQLSVPHWELKKNLYQEKVRSLVIFCTYWNNYLPRSKSYLCHVLISFPSLYTMMVYLPCQRWLRICRTHHALP